jgi:N6-adenosine-specific RNA methylase IME4
MTETPEMPEGEFDLIYADPPWSYHDGGVPRGGVDKEYATLSVEDIADLSVPAADNALLYLWTTVTHVPEALDVLNAWGFEYKSQAVWDKGSVGVGHWFRGQHEILLLGVKGDVSPPAQAQRHSSVFYADRGEHSEKPDKIRAYIENAHPEADKLELFSRDGRVGWTMWGNETVSDPQSLLEQYGLDS